MTFFSRKFFAILLGLATVWLSLRFLLPILAPFLLAALLALAAEPMVSALNNRLRLPRGAASAISVSLVLVLTALLVVALCALLVRELGALAGVLPDLENAAMSGLHSLENWLLELAQKAPQGMGSILTGSVESMFSNGSMLLSQVSSKLLALASTVLKSLPDSALGLGTWVLATFMISVRLPAIRKWLAGLLPDSWHERIVPHLRTFKKSIWGWLTAQAKLVGVTFIILTTGFFLLQIAHPLLWAAVVCLVDILPILGTGTVLIPWALVCFLQGDSLRSLGLLSIYAVVSLVRSILEPRLVGKELGLDPLVTLLSIYAGYRLWGLPGMLFAPVLAVAATQILPKPKKQP